MGGYITFWECGRIRTERIFDLWGEAGILLIDTTRETIYFMFEQPCSN
jgi:hypothetical protein